MKMTYRGYIYCMDDLKISSDEDLYCGDLVARTAFENFGIKYMFPWQRLVVSNILEAYEYQKQVEKMSVEEKAAFDEENDDSFCKGRQIVLLPTGAGKSLCFQVPALLLDGPTLVIYPLLALMTDQQRRMEEGGLGCVVFRGGQSEEERKENFQRLRDGAKIVLANPEVMESEELLDRLAEIGIRHVAIDEAHISSEWGNTFRKSYLDLGKMIKRINPPVITAFTATASPEVLKNVAEIIFDGEAHIVRSESDRKNIHYYVRYAAAKKKEALFLAQTELHPMIIFCGTRDKAEDMAMELNVCFGPGTAKFYHAGLEKAEKEKVEKWFYDSKDGVLCATCAYGMGVDKKDIKTVVHLVPPVTAEAYLQESGRGGRNGDVAKGILLWSLQDSLDFSKYEKGSREESMKIFAETMDCRRQVLLDALGGEQAVCSGCDLCDARNGLMGVESELKNKYGYSPENNADWRLCMDLVTMKKNHYTEESLEEELFYLMNEKSLSVFGKKIWAHSDVVEIVSQLLASGKIKSGEFPWKGRIRQA